MKQKLSIVSRAVGVLGLLVASVGGVTYAAMTSNSVTLSGTTLSTGSAELRIYNFTAGRWDTTAQGFDIDDLVPGEGVTKQFYLQNSGDVDLDIRAQVSELPMLTGFDGAENVTVVITGQECGESVETDLAELNREEGVELPCNPLDEGAAGDSNVAGTAGNYDITFDIDPEAVNDDRASVGAFDIVFTGTATTSDDTQNPTTPPADGEGSDTGSTGGTGSEGGTGNTGSETGSNNGSDDDDGDTETDTPSAT